MAIKSLDELKAAFGAWRLTKQHLREPVPEKLMELARRAAAVHGVGPVAQAINFDYSRLKGAVSAGARGGKRPSRRFARRGDKAVVAAKPKRASASRAKKVALAAIRAKRVTTPVPSYSRIEFPASKAATQPLAEVETAVGVKLRVFTITPETVALLSSLSGLGRAL